MRVSINAPTGWALTRYRVSGLWGPSRAGGGAVRPAQAAPSLNPLTQLASDEERRLNEHFLNKDGGRERIATIRTEMQKPWNRARIYRDEAELCQT